MQQPEPAGVERLRGIALYEQGQIQPAAAALERALAQDPADREAMQMEGVALFRTGLLKQQDPVMAKMYLDKALALDPGNYTTHTLLGQAYRSLGQSGQASHEFQLAEQIQAGAQPKLDTVK